MREPVPPSKVDVRPLHLKPLSALFSELFNFPRAAMYFLLLVRCAVENISMEALCEKEMLSSDRMFFYMWKMSVEHMTCHSNKMLKHVFKNYWKNRKNHRRVILAVDTSDIAYDGNDEEYLHNKVKKRTPKKGSKIKTLRYAAISIVSKEFKHTLAVRIIHREEKLKDTLDMLLQEVPSCLKPFVKAVIMDKGFYYSEVFEVMDKHGMKYAVPIKQYPSMNFEYHIAELTEVWDFQYTMNQGHTSRTIYTFNVHLQDEGIEDYIGYASNIDMSNRDFQTLMQIYRHRWNIENGFKESKQYRIKTNSRNIAYRVLIYAISHILMNLHVITRKTNKIKLTTEMMKQVFQTLLTTRPRTRPRTKHLTKHVIITY